MKKNVNSNEDMQEAKKKIFWDKRIVLVAEVSLCIIAALVFAFVPNEIVKGIASNVMTALIVTLLGTIVSWKTETDVERAIKEEEKTTSERIEAVQQSTQKILDTIQESANEMFEKMGKNIDGLTHGLCSLNESTDNFSSALDEFNGKACTFCKNYIKAIKQNRADCHLDEFFAKAKRSICILATNLESFTDYLPQFKKLAKSGIEIRISAIHPTFAKDFNLARFIGDTPPKERWEKMKDSLQKFLAFVPNGDISNELFQVRAYSKITPTLIMIMVDNDCYVAYLINGKKSRDTIHFLFTADESDLHSPVRYFKQHFESTWNDEGTRECDLNEILSLTYEKAEA